MFSLTFVAEAHDHDELQIDFRIKRDVVDNEGGQLVGETKCENIPRRVCIPNNCGMTESKEEECHNKKSLVLQEIPEEVWWVKFNLSYSYNVILYSLSNETTNNELHLFLDLRAPTVQKM